MTIENRIRRCVHCDEHGAETNYTDCANCGSGNCPDHVETERLDGEPVCTGCAVTERFALKTKYFYNEENLEAFRREYEAMAAHEKVRENPYPVVGLAVAVLLLMGLVVAAGV